MGFIAHHERERGGIGDRVGGGIMGEFHHGKEFGPFSGLIFGKDPKVGFKFLVDLLRFAISLWVVGGEEGDVIFEEASQFLSKGRGELGASVRDDTVMETKLGEDMLKKDLSNVHCKGSFVARAENYPL